MDFLSRVYFCLKWFSEPNYEKNKILIDIDECRMSPEESMTFISRWVRLEKLHSGHTPEYIDEVHVRLNEKVVAVMNGSNYRSRRDGSGTMDGRQTWCKYNGISSPLHLGVLCKYSFEVSVPRAILTIDHWDTCILHHIESVGLKGLLKSNLTFYGKAEEVKVGTVVKAADLLQSYSWHSGVTLQASEIEDKLNEISGLGFYIRINRCDFRRAYLATPAFKRLYSTHALEFDISVLSRKLNYVSRKHL